MSKVVSIFDASKKVKEVEENKNQEGSYDFEEAIRRNKANKEREKRDRAKNNTGVTRSYRLKH